MCGNVIHPNPTSLVVCHCNTKLSIYLIKQEVNSLRLIIMKYLYLTRIHLLCLGDYMSSNTEPTLLKN